MATVDLSNLNETRGIDIKRSILKDVQEKCKSMEIVTHMVSEKEVVRVPLLKDGCTANEVAESDIIGSQNINLEYKEAKMKKVGVIVPYTYESVDFTDLSNLPQELQAIIVDAIVKKMDADVLACAEEGAVEVSATGDIVADYNELFSKVEENHEVSALALKNADKKALRTYMANADNQGVGLNSVFGVQPTFFKNCNDMAIAKDKLFLITKNDIQVEELKEACITVNGSLISLAERNMRAVKVYVYYTVLKTHANAVAKLV